MTNVAAIFLIILIIIEGCICAGPSYLNAEVTVKVKNKYGQVYSISVARAGLTNDRWGWYQGGIPPHLWYTLPESEACAGRSQSPINIQTKDVIRTRRIPPFDFSDLANTHRLKMSLINTGRRAQVDFKCRKPTIQGGGLPGKFQLETLHLHWGKYNHRGSEHKVNGKQSAMELHFEFKPVGVATQYTQGAAVIGVLIRVGKYNRKYAKLISHLRKIPDVGKKTYLPIFPIKNLLPDNTCCYYRYKGSLTTPPCSETILWTFFKDIVYISQKQINEFRRLKGKSWVFTKPGRRIVDTYRPCQKLNSRKVLLNCEVKS